MEPHFIYLLFSGLFSCIKFPTFFFHRGKLPRLYLFGLFFKEAESLTQRSDSSNGGFEMFIYSQL